MKIPVLLRKIPVYEDWLKENTDVYKAKDLDDFERKAGMILRGEAPNLTEAGYRIAEERSIEKVGKRLAGIYEECLENV